MTRSLSMSRDDAIVYETAFLESAAEDMPWILANWGSEAIARRARLIGHHGRRLLALMSEAGSQ